MHTTEFLLVPTLGERAEKEVLLMHIFLTGASGFIGQRLMIALLAEGHQLVACVRQPAKWQPRFPEVQWIQGDYTKDHELQRWVPRLSNIEVIINAVGIIQETKAQRFEDLHTRTPIALFQAAQQVGIQKILQISALGADEQAQSQYHLSKRVADEALLALAVDAVIVQPSIVIGRGSGSTRLFSGLAALPWIPLVESGKQRLQPIHIDDLIACVSALLRHWPSGKLRVPLVGAQSLTFLELLRVLREWLNFPAEVVEDNSHSVRYLPIPLPVVTGLAKITDQLGIGWLTTESLGMLRRGNCGDPTLVTALTGVKPRTIQASLRSTPATTGDRWQARLFFLRPGLRWSIGLLWLFTGIISAWLYPVANSYELLTATGITGILAPLMLYSAATLDMLLGIAMLFNYRLRLVVSLQLLLIVSYTAIITWALPDLWFHPFGPVTKNLPLLVATLVLLMLEED